MQPPTGNPFSDAFLKPWYEGLHDPAETQARTLEWLKKGYARTDYGRDHGIEEARDFDGYRSRLPKLAYRDLERLLEPVKKGSHEAFLPEPPQKWVMTRGTTGTPKFLPATATHLLDILMCGSRALLNHLRRNPEVRPGKILNLSFPSRVATLEAGGGSQDFGYSSGTYSGEFPSLGDAMLIPRQEEIDALGPGIKKDDWERRFELVYRAAHDEEVFAVIGVAPVILSFARYVSRAHGKKPGEIWEPRAIICTSVRKIQVKYKPLFERYFGGVSTVEIYSATEGVFAQQRDDLPYVSPNYDRYLFEVETGSGTRMLHELERGEWGRLIVSSCMFPRYDIGDMVEAMGDQYFRVFGRAKWTHIWEHRLYRALFKWFL
jgi:hypothetical protein